MKEKSIEDIINLSHKLRVEIGGDFHDHLAEGIYADASEIAKGSLRVDEPFKKFRFDRKIDKIVTSKIWGFPIMFFILGVVLWLTIKGANYPSSLLANLFLDTIHPILKNFASNIGMPWWLSGFLIDGVYLAVAWVIAVMLPPMAIFFPMFTLLEDFGYLPRVAFNLDYLFRKSGAHGKQALTMSMGFGCNAAGVVATRIIDSPRERLIAIITNNFSLCNGRWPTQILIATATGYLGSRYPVAVVPELSITELIERIASLRLFISPDNGPMHIASAVSVPVIALFRVDNRERFKPLSKGSEALYMREGSDPEEAARAVLKTLGSY